MSVRSTCRPVEGFAGAPRVAARQRVRIGARAVRTAVASALVASAVLSSTATAQAFNYPSLQLPKASTRDYTAALTGGTGTTAVFQWREGWSSKRHLQLDVGLSDRKGNQSLLMFAGGYFGSELVSATAEQPLDLLLTGGAGASFGDGFALFRVPVGVSLGHTFELDQGMSLTPYLHPRASLDFCASCSSRGGSRSELSLNFDVGASFQVTKAFAVRASGAFSGSDLIGTDDTFAVGFTWTPTPLIRERRR